MREIIQVIRCDLCHKKVDSEEQLTEFTLSWNKGNFELEVCGNCEGRMHLQTIEKLMEIGHQVQPTPQNRSRKSKTPGPTLLHPELVCPTCGEEKASPAGLGRHRAAKHGYVSPKHKKEAVPV